MLSQGLPIKQAFNLGAERVIALRTCSPQGHSEDGFVTQRIILPYIARHSSKVSELIGNRKERTQIQIQPYLQDPRVLMVSPSHMIVRTFTTNQNKLWQQVGIG